MNVKEFKAVRARVEALEAEIAEGSISRLRLTYIITEVFNIAYSAACKDLKEKSDD